MICNSCGTATIHNRVYRTMDSNILECSKCGSPRSIKRDYTLFLIVFIIVLVVIATILS